MGRKQARDRGCPRLERDTRHPLLSLAVSFRLPGTLSPGIVSPGYVPGLIFEKANTNETSPTPMIGEIGVLLKDISSDTVPVTLSLD